VATKVFNQNLLEIDATSTRRVPQLLASVNRALAADPEPRTRNPTHVKASSSWEYIRALPHGPNMRRIERVRLADGSENSNG
jgi:hypothetical protein